MCMLVFKKRDFGLLVQGMHEILELLDSDWGTLKHIYLKINNTYELSVLLFLDFCLGIRV